MSANRISLARATPHTPPSLRHEVFRAAGYAAATGDAIGPACLQLADDPLPPACWMVLALDLSEGLEEGMRGRASRSAQAWTSAARALLAFLTDLESQRGACGMTRAIATEVERSIPAEVVPWSGLTAGFVQAIRLEATRTIEGVAVAQGIEILRAIVTVEGCALGEIARPVCDGLVAREVVADAIAAQFAWPLLGRFFARTIYPDLDFQEQGNGFACLRDGLRLASGLTLEDCAFAELHDRVGWTVFLQEIWGLPDWSEDRFTKGALEIPASGIGGTPKRMRLEIAGSLGNLDTRAGEVELSVTLGGAGLLSFRVPARRRAVTAQQLRAAIIRKCGTELCRVAVREGIVGRLLSGPPLRARLAAAAAQRGDEPIVGLNG
jgi:hypothetical protein